MMVKPKSCQNCDRKDAIRQRQKTNYVCEEDNWVVLCPECMKENNEYWEDAWAEYYRECI